VPTFHGMRPGTPRVPRTCASGTDVFDSSSTGGSTARRPQPRLRRPPTTSAGAGGAPPSSRRRCSSSARSPGRRRPNRSACQPLACDTSRTGSPDGETAAARSSVTRAIDGRRHPRVVSLRHRLRSTTGQFAPGDGEGGASHPRLDIPKGVAAARRLGEGLGHRFVRDGGRRQKRAPSATGADTSPRNVSHAL
jgi:hypothetical protein